PQRITFNILFISNFKTLHHTQPSHLAKLLTPLRTSHVFRSPDTNFLSVPKTNLFDVKYLPFHCSHYLEFPTFVLLCLFHHFYLDLNSYFPSIASLSLSL